MLSIFKLLAVIIFSTGFSPYAYSNIESTENINQCQNIEIFSKKGCPHCAKAYAFFDELQLQYPELNVISRDIQESQSNAQRFLKLNQRYAIEQPGVPLILVCEHFMIGFDTSETTGSTIKRWLGLSPLEQDSPEESEIQVPLLGGVSVSTLGLPLFTIVIGLLDGFNPCAMWVLLILLSLLVNLRDRRRIMLIAGIFVLVSGLVYFAFMAAWLNLFLIIGYSRLIQISTGLIAMIIGAIHIKDFVAFKKGLSLSIPDSAKGPIYARIRRILNADDLFAALIGVTILAVLVNLVELLCTAGLPALYTQILVNSGLDQLQYYAYLFLYNLAYMFDDAIMVGIAAYSLGSFKLQEKSGRWLKLLSGSLIFSLGALLVIAPQLLF
jgi:glutaredoxin